MGKIFRPICWIRTIWYTAGRLEFWKDGIFIEGCDYIEQENGDLVCKVCGKINKYNN